MAKTALVTGGSRGIGRACALEFAKAGFNVAITFAGNVEKANATIKDLEAFGIKAKAYQFDISDRNATNEAISTIHADFETIDILVNNAGITRDNLIIRMSDEEWESVINTNLTGVFNVTKPVSKIMMKQRQGSIVNMTSIVGVSGNAGQSNYSAAKAGLIGFTKSLAKELAPRNIRVNAVAPGFVQTDMTAGLDTDMIIQHIPLKRLGEPEDIAKIVKFLAVDATYITAQILGVDGGLSI